MSSEYSEIAYITALMLFCVLMLDKLLHIDISKLGWRRARRKFPDLAAHLGLEYISPQLKDYIGQIKGDYHGYQVSIRPDDNAIIEISQIGSLRFSSSSLMLSTYKSQLTSPPEDMWHFDSGNRDFDRFFGTRYAKHEVANNFTASASKLYCVGQFRKAWNNVIRYVEVGDSGVRCSLKYGMISSYIPAEVLEKILPDLCALAKVFESLLSSRDFS